MDQVGKMKAPDLPIGIPGHLQKGAVLGDEEAFPVQEEDAVADRLEELAIFPFVSPRGTAGFPKSGEILADCQNSQGISLFVLKQREREESGDLSPPLPQELRLVTLQPAPAPHSPLHLPGLFPPPGVKVRHFPSGELPGRSPENFLRPPIGKGDPAPEVGDPNRVGGLLEQALEQSLVQGHFL